MYLRIFLSVACLSLMTASEADAQLFRRFRARTAQPQQYAPPAGYSQNGYQGRPTATPRPRQTRPTMYVRRSDGSVVPYYPNNVQAAATQPQRTLNNRQSVAERAKQARAANAESNFATTEGQLTAVRPPATYQRRVGNTYQQPTPQLASQPQTDVAPVGVSVLTEPTLGSISPATPMPQASVSPTVDVASSIPVSSAATNPAPRGLSLSLEEDVVPASANTPVGSTSVLEPAGQESFSVLETIE